jgi:putative ABC transport system permease protein
MMFTGSGKSPGSKTPVALNDSFIQEISGYSGVDMVFPENRFPAIVRFGDQQDFSFVQVLPADIARSKLMKLRNGSPYREGDEKGLIVSDSFLHGLGVRDFDSAVGRKVLITTLTLDFSGRKKIPFGQNTYEFEVAGVAERIGIGGPLPIKSDIYIPPAPAAKMNKIELSDLWDLFRPPDREGYSLLTIRAKSPRQVHSIKEKLEKKGLNTFALIDQMEEIKTGFLFMDLFLAAVGMIAIIVSSLGIVNTMVMSTMERYTEIGVMKAVGARDRDVQKIFFFESGTIGLLGGIFGLLLGWGVSRIINAVANYFAAKQAIPHIQYFAYPWWLCVGAVLFSIVVSLISGIYPALRAARVDPVVALRHD